MFRGKKEKGNENLSVSLSPLLVWWSKVGVLPCSFVDSLIGTLEEKVESPNRKSHEAKKGK